MKKLLDAVSELQKKEIKKKIDVRMKEFDSVGDVFSELCFCILTANFNAEKSINIQKNVRKGFHNMPEERLAKFLKNHGHRYPNARANYIVHSRKCKKSLEDVLNYRDENKIREWLVKNVKGLGYKEASHFMRNIGFRNVAIIDFHIIDLLVKYKIIERPKTITKKRYLEIEQVLARLAAKLHISLAELDLYLWYMETGKILK
jgi:N-glycosylase/DNA lyase